MKALITGGAGFIGYHLANLLLESGYEVVLADNFSRGVNDKFLNELLQSPNVECKSVDLMERDQLNSLDGDFDYIYHFAAIIGVQNVLKRPYDVLHNNVELTFNMIDFARKQSNLKRFIFASTSEIYAGTLLYHGLEIPTPENTPLTLTPLESARTSYMLSKIYGEALLQQSGIPFTIIRPHNFYGPRMGLSHVIPELLKKAYFAASDGTLEVFSIEHKRTFCYISDAVKIINQLAESDDTQGQAYNIGNETPEVSIGELAKIILEVTGRDIKIAPQPATAGSPSRRCPSMKKVRRFIEIEKATSLREGVQKTFDWYKTNIFDDNGVSAK